MCKCFILLLVFVCVDSRLLGTFELSQISSYCLRHVCPTVGMCHLASDWTDFRGIWCRLLLKSVEKIKICLRYCKNIGHLSTYCCRCDSKSPLSCSIRLKSYQDVISFGSLFVCVCASIRPRVSDRLPLEWFTWNFVLRTSLKICRGISDLFKIRRKIPNCCQRR
jgi:hypothetical protein